MEYTLCCPSGALPRSCSPTGHILTSPGHVQSTRGPITLRLSWKRALQSEHSDLTSERTSVERRGRDAHSPERGTARTSDLSVPLKWFIRMNFLASCRTRRPEVAGTDEWMGRQKIARTWIACADQFFQLCQSVRAQQQQQQQQLRRKRRRLDVAGDWAAARGVRVSQSPTLQCHRPGWWSLVFCSMCSLEVGRVLLGAFSSLNRRFSALLLYLSVLCVTFWRCFVC